MNDMEESTYDLPSGELHLQDVTYNTLLTRTYMLRKPYKPVDLGKVVSFIPGTIRTVYVKPGQKVKAGDKLLVLEAMKMLNNIVAMKSGKITSLNVKVGSVVAKNEILAEIS